MDANSKSRQSLRRYQFGARSLLVLVMLSALLVQIGPPAYNRLFPSLSEFPTMWITNDDVQYFPVESEFKLSAEAAALREALKHESTGQ